MSARTACISPALLANADGTRPAFELKFALPSADADTLQEWASERLQPDPHSDPSSGYLITSTYFDTPAYDVFHRSPGFDIHKYRVRRYGTEPTAHLERKSKSAGRVWKRRGSMPMADLTRPFAKWSEGWFTDEVTRLGLRPVCSASYRRVAFVGDTVSGAVRLTVDRAAFGRPTSMIELHPLADGPPLLPELAVVEFKFLTALPVLFKEAVERFGLRPTGVSKFRRCVRATGLVTKPEGAIDA